MEARVSERNLLQTWIDGIRNKLQKNNKLKDVLVKIKEATSIEEVISGLLSLEEVQNALERLRTRMPGSDKSGSESESLRMKANEQLSQGDYKNALDTYNLSVCAAPVYDTATDDGDEYDSMYAMALASRSASLFHLKHYDLCIKDIDLSIANGYPNHIRYKLLDRKGRSLMKMGKFHGARVYLEDSIAHLKKFSQDEPTKILKYEADFRRSLDRCQDLCNNNTENEGNRTECLLGGMTFPKQPKLKERNRDVPALSSKCEVLQNEIRGRHIVAKQDILPGEVLLEEIPYASILLPTFYDTHCHNCFCRLIAAVPCSVCRCVQFCSTECYKVATKSYHKFECLILDMLVSCGVDRIGLLALRTVSVTPFSDLIASENQSQEGSKLKGAWNSYNDIKNLITHFHDRSGVDLLVRSLEAFFMAHIFKNSCYIPTGDSCDPQVFKRVSSAILHLLQLLPCNAHSISEFSLDLKKVVESKPKEIGAGIYATHSLLNHSCDPGITRSNFGSTIISRSITYMRKGEEITDNYGAVYAVQSRKKRVSVLAPQYFFNCSCNACFNDWPLSSDDLCFAPRRWRCAHCGEELRDKQLMDECSNGDSLISDKSTKSRNADEDHEGKSNCEHPQEQAKMRSFEGTNEFELQCENCKFIDSISSKKEQLKMSGASYQIALKNLKEGKVEEALPFLLDHLTLMEKHVMHPWRDITICQEAVKQCYSIMSNCHSGN